MGQKVHPGGLRVGVIHDWKSNWYVGKKEFPTYILEDVRIRDHITGKLGHAGLSDILIRKDKQRITIELAQDPKAGQRRPPRGAAPTKTEAPAPAQASDQQTAEKPKRSRAKKKEAVA